MLPTTATPPTIDRLKRALPDWLVMLVRYHKSHGTLPRLLRPQTFNEKVLHRILFSRSAWMATVADKLAARDFVEQRVGAAMLPKLHAVTTEPATIPFDRLPNRFVAKPTHGSGWVEMVPDKAALDRASLVRTCERWLATNYYDLTREWSYRHVPPRIMVEEMINDGTGSAPSDYKLFVFDGRVELVLVTMGRFGARAHVAVDRGWNEVDVTFAYSAERRRVPPPPHLTQMVEAAETLGRGLDFVRVDFFDTPDRLVFGELTATPGCGMDPFEPRSFDAQLGSFWTLSTNRGR